MIETVEDFVNDKVVGSTHSYHWKYPYLHSRLPFWINTYGPVQIVGLCHLILKNSSKGELPTNGWLLLSLHGPAQGGGEKVQAFLRDQDGSYGDILAAVGRAESGAAFAGCYFFYGEYHSPTIWFKDKELGICTVAPENFFATNLQTPFFAEEDEYEEKINKLRKEKGLPIFEFGKTLQDKIRLDKK